MYSHSVREKARLRYFFRLVLPPSSLVICQKKDIVREKFPEIHMSDYHAVKLKKTDNNCSRKSSKTISIEDVFHSLLQTEIIQNKRRGSVPAQIYPSGPKGILQ
jgi:hypothetical protein